MKLPRRHLFTMLAVIVACMGVVVYLSGVRYPPLQLAPATAPTRGAVDDEGSLEAEARGAIFQHADDGRLVFRAFVPEPEVWVRAPGEAGWRVEIGNIHPQAALEAEPAGPEETIDGLRRVVSGRAGLVRLRWRFPKQQRYRFAAVGDTGGGRELRWVLRRVAELGADFVVYLGDFYYGPGEYLGAVAAFDEAPVPVYATIGNHDYFDGFAAVHQLFRSHVGPRNMTFRLGPVQFIGVDTAADFYPADGGARGRFLGELQADPNAADVVAFTHKPLADPRPGEAYTVSTSEVDYLRGQFRRLGVTTLLAGHIHIREDFDDQGVRTLISGEGLAHADLIVDRPFAQVLLGDVAPGKPVSYSWAPIDMPFEAHCNPRAWNVLGQLNKPEVLARLKPLCSGQ